jgi:hypothetical protein
VTLELKEWADRIFGGPVVPDFQRLPELGQFCGPDLATLLRLAEIFEDAGALLGPYSDESLDQAFWDLSSEVFFGLIDESIGRAVRDRLVRSFETLFRKVFAVRCRPVLGHRQEGGSPLNSACYMWWDHDCWRFAPDPRTMDSVFLASMRSILAIDHVACQESALHGLGHWHKHHPAAVEEIIDEFLGRSPRLREELREYANSARAGRVL